MFQKFGVLAMVPVLVAAAPAYAEWHGNAHIESVEVTGSYLTDDTSEAGLQKAREEAHKDALRLATEKAGVFVQSYSRPTISPCRDDSINICQHPRRPERVVCDGARRATATHSSPAT